MIFEHCKFDKLIDVIFQLCKTLIYDMHFSHLEMMQESKGMYAQFMSLQIKTVYSTENLVK